jgi:hypothetical protein
VPTPTLASSNSYTATPPAASATASAPVPTISNSSSGTTTVTDIIADHRVVTPTSITHVQAGDSLLLVNNRLVVQISPGIYL